MSNLREVRTRITSIKSTRQITSAMKMVSASKLRKAQTAIEKLRYYTNHFKEILNDLAKTVSISQDNKYTIKKDGNKALVVICSSNKGLCGPYNYYILRKAVTHINYLVDNGHEVSLYLIGKKAHEFFKKREFEILKVDEELNENLTFENTQKFAELLKNYFTNNEFVRIDAVYNKFKNAVVQEPNATKILPVDFNDDANKDKENDTFKPDREHLKHELEPSSTDIIDFVIPKYIDNEVYRILLDAYASEQGARMTAMHQATENASDLISNLTLQYNKARQATITKELVEIVSGAEALK